MQLLVMGIGFLKSFDRPVGGALWLSCLQATAPPSGAVSSEASFVLKMKIGFGYTQEISPVNGGW